MSGGSKVVSIKFPSTKTAKRVCKSIFFYSQFHFQ
ncbi:hypothetical protein Pint_21504 [Pistacia integerrima]|uniref:Uncharacterized protein n=1 Tax=Pistacia integerrima TaxID=434235 RepID=A0ACC0XCZ6_9ROSI|nr:hypothetical protein Pint_21504 [Pistacia integerrima]